MRRGFTDSERLLPALRAAHRATALGDPDRATFFLSDIEIRLPEHRQSPARLLTHAYVRLRLRTASTVQRFDLPADRTVEIRTPVDITNHHRHLL